MSHQPSSDEGSKGGFNISEIAINRPVTTTMMILILLVMGMLSYQRLPVELFPDVSFPIVSITTTYPGASAREMETLVSKPIEDGLSAINGIEHITSTSSSGISTVILQFQLEKNIKDAANEVQEKMALVRPTLPTDVDEPLIARVDPNAVPVQFYTLTGTLPLEQLTDFARDDLKPRLQKVDGVAEVNLLGGQEREVQVMLNPAALSQYKLTSAQVVGRLQQENLDFPSGQIETLQQRIILRTVNSYKTAAQIAQTPIQISGGKVVLLSDLGTVRDGFRDANTYTAWNGKPAVVLSIQKQSGTNTVEMAHRLGEEVAALQKSVPPGMEIELAFDTAKFVEESKEASIEELIIGSILAIIVIFIFLRTVRGTIIAAIAIPTSVISTYTFMGMMGFSLNFMSLMALSLVVGILVDDAVVDLENIFRHIEMGESPYQAAIKATNEIGLAVVATTFSIVAVFAPVGFMGGMIGRFFRQFGLTVSVAVLVSLLVARTLTPMLSAYFLKPMPIKHEDEHEAAAKGIGGIYQGMLKWVLHHRIVTVILAFLVFVAAIPIAGLLPTGFAPSNDQDEFSIAVELPSGSSLAQTRGILEEISRRVKADPMVDTLLLTAGSSRGNTDSGSLAVTLKSKKEGRKESSFSIQARMQTDMKSIPGAVISFREAGGVDNGTGANAAMNLSLQGDNLEELQVLADQIVDKLRRMPVVTDVKTSTGTPRQEINLRVDHRRAMELGVTTATIASTIRAASLGDKATQMRLETNNVDVRVRLDDSSRYDISRLQSLPIMTASGSEIPLGALAAISYEMGPTNINRYDRERQVMVYANNVPGSPLSEILNPVTELLKTMELPEGVSYEFQGEAERMKDSFGLMGGAMLLAVLFIYMILASQFEHFFHPFTIMMAVPLSFAGAFLGLFLANKEMGLMSMIGIIMLMGLVVKNSILLVDYTITLRKQGIERNQALLMAGPIRLRPILMTTVAMVAGMIPVAMQLTIGSETRSPMAVAVIGGLITSTFLTLLVVPVAYTIMDDLVNWGLKAIGWDPAAVIRGQTLSVKAQEPVLHIAEAEESKPLSQVGK
jgi:HAE1 family hydrophobic/amphiphilic exporter-1